MVEDQDLRAALSADLDGTVSCEADRLLRRVVDAFGSATAAVIHYGSHAQGSGGAPESAYDFFVIVDDYNTAYAAFAARVRPRFRSGTAALLARMLPPNVVAVTVAQESSGDLLTAKCAVLSQRDLAFLCSRHAPDHFTQGRLFQQVQLAWSRSEAERAAVQDALVRARANTFRWGKPYLPAAFDVDSYCRTLLATSYAGEIRPEKTSRVEEVFAAQRGTLVTMYSPLLNALAERGALTRGGAHYTVSRPPSRTDRLAVASYFRRSKARATLRWVKHIWLYDDWLEYIRQKIARRSGVVIELTPRERRWPLLFLWQKAIRYLGSRD